MNWKLLDFLSFVKESSVSHFTKISALLGIYRFLVSYLPPVSSGRSGIISRGEIKERRNDTRDFFPLRNPGLSD
jgi:TctA family transporter